MTVCPVCWTRLSDRQAFENRMVARKLSLQVWMIRQRELARQQSVRLQALRAWSTGQAAAYRTVRRLRDALAEVISRARRPIR